MKLAAVPIPRSDRARARLLVVDPHARRVHDDHITALAHYLGPGDAVVVNDAATVPASLSVRAPSGRPHELRLTAVRPEPWVWLFGPGDWRTPTERRPALDLLEPGDALELADGHRIEILERSPISPRKLRVRLAGGRDALLERLYRLGRPIQYAYLARPVALAETQTPLATRPVAVEAPSAAHPLTWAVLESIRSTGAELVPLTHAAGLSATSDPHLDATLPDPERYWIPEVTARAVSRADRVLALGTTVMRALEGSVASHGCVVAGAGITDLVIAPGFVPRVVDGLLSGVHDDGSSHHRIVAALLSDDLTQRALRAAARAGYRNHEYGDAMLIWPGALGDLRATA